jgi:hypothetical protein
LYGWVAQRNRQAKINGEAAISFLSMLELPWIRAERCEGNNISRTVKSHCMFQTDGDRRELNHWESLKLLYPQQWTTDNKQRAWWPSLTGFRWWNSMQHVDLNKTYLLFTQAAGDEYFRLNWPSMKAQDAT